MFSRSAKRLAVTGVAFVAVAGMLVGCTDDGTGGPSGTDKPADVINVTITSVAADKSVERPIQEWFMDEIEKRTDGRVIFHRTTNNEICAQSDQYVCLTNGSAGLMVQVPNYQPTVFAPSSLPEITFNPGADNAAALSAAMYELYQNNADVKAFYDAKGLVPVATWTVGRVLLGTSVPVDSIDDLQGLTMRTAGTIAAPDLAAAGVIPTQVTADEAYNSFSTGLVKGAAGAMDFVSAWKLGEVLPYWTDPGLGVYSEFAMFWSKDQWNAFPADIQEIITQVTDELNDGKVADLYQDGYTSHPMGPSASTEYIGTTQECQEIQAMPAVKSMTKWSDDAVAAFKALGAKTDKGNVSNEDLWVSNATAAGLQNAKGVLDEYMSNLDKFQAKYPDYAKDAVTNCIDSYNK